MTYNAIVIGAGISGATCARKLADNGEKVLVIDKFNHVGGNTFDYKKDEILVHKYGPHIFHTNNKEVFDFLSQYTNWFKYEHKVLASLKDKYIPVPFNLDSLKTCYSKEDCEKIKKILLEEYGENKKVSILELRKNPNKIIKDFAQFVVDNIFTYYSEKQWGTTIDKLDPNTISRVPVYTSYNDKYFTDEFQFQPIEGFTKLLSNMLDHPNIDVKLNVQAKDVISIKDNQVFYLNEKFDGITIFTGPIDEFLDNKFGALPYRSLKFEFEEYDLNSYQPAAVVNYTVDQNWTRISEFKKFTTLNPPKDKSIIVKEFSLAYKQNCGMIPYYPIINEKNMEIFNKYWDYCSKIKNFYLCGRLGNYKYINMDVAVKNAIDLTNEIINKENK